MSETIVTPPDAPPYKVVRNDWALGYSEIISREADARLQPFVASYHGYVEAVPGVARVRHVPSGSVGIIFGFGPPMYETSKGPERARGKQLGVFIAAIHDTYSLGEWDGVSRGVEAMLSPLGARLVLGVPMSELSNQTVELAAVLGPGARHLTERLESAAGWAPRFAILDAFFARRLIESNAFAPGVAWAWRRLTRSGGQTPIAPLAEALGVTQKRLIAEFRDQIGLPPKTVARILRFDRAVKMINRPGEPDWIEIAMACGYYDQPHFVREFKEFAGATPSEFLELRLGGGGLMA